MRPAGNTTRRGFLATATAASAARVLGANDRINVGIIGVGGKGTAHLRELVAQSKEEGSTVQVVAVADVYTKRVARARELAKLAEKDGYRDYRDLLARKDVDAVFIATPDHWHSRHAIDAMTAGKDVYLQKPMTLTVEEARQTAEAAKRLGRVLQIGSQHASDPRYHEARKVIEQGEIGELLWAQGAVSRNSTTGEWNYSIDKEASPETLDWQRWLGSAPKHPFSTERYFRWRKYWDYSGGIATDLFYHKLNPILLAMGPQFPTRVTGAGGIYVQKDRDVPDTYASIIEYPNFYINLSSSMANAAGTRYMPDVIYGHKGTIAIQPNGIQVTGEGLERGGGPLGRVRGGEPEGKTYEVKMVNVNRAHPDNFFKCMRTRKKPVLNGDFGYQVMVAIKLGVDSYREGRLKFFDPSTQREIAKPAPRPAYDPERGGHGTA